MILMLAHMTESEWPGFALTFGLGFLVGVAVTLACLAYKLKS